MKEVEIICLNKKEYADVIGYIHELTTLRFKNLNPTDEIVNAIMIKLLNSSAFSNSAGYLQDFILSIFPKAVEEVFNYYQKVSFQYCLVKTHDHNLSEDISQEAMKQLLLSKTLIKDVNSWLRQVTHNLLCKHYKILSKDKDLYKLLCIEASILQKVMASGNTIDIEGLNPLQKNEILSSQQYSDYLHLLTFNSIKDYAFSMNVSVKVAQKRKERVIRDLRSKILLAIGWEASREILSYNQYNAILKFIRNLLKPDRGSKDIYKNNILYQSLCDVMHGIDRIDDWGITMVDNRKFRLHIFHLSQNKQPIIATFFIVLNERNHISVENCKKNEIIGAHLIPANIQIPKEMGKALWSYEKILSLLNS